MPLEAIAPLTFLLEVLKSLVSDAAKERLKPATSLQTARKRAFDLYQQIERVVFSSGEFVRALEGFVSAAADAGGAPAGSYEKASLLEAIDAVAEDLDRMTAAVEHLQPQLNIFRPDVFRSLYEFRGVRDVSLDLSRRRAELNSFAKRDLRELRELVNTARANQERILAIAEEYRSFLAATFTFKESF